MHRGPGVINPTPIVRPDFNSREGGDTLQYEVVASSAPLPLGPDGGDPVSLREFLFEGEAIDGVSYDHSRTLEDNMSFFS